MTPCFKGQKETPGIGSYRPLRRRSLVTGKQRDPNKAKNRKTGELILGKGTGLQEEAQNWRLGGWQKTHSEPSTT